jgi:lipoic acid synthetase
MRPEMITKSGLMAGLGEAEEEVIAALRELRRGGVAAVTIGQYLQPTRRHRSVRRYIEPQEFAALEREARIMGFGEVKAGPFVRSSYRAGQ